MNIIRALISQLYGFAGTLAIAKSRSLNTIRSISFISRPRLWLWFGAGRTEPSWFNNLKLPYTMRGDLILPLGNCARGNVEQLGKRRRAASEIDCLLFIHAIL